MGSIYGRFSMGAIHEIKEKLNDVDKLELWYFNQTIRLGNFVTEKSKKIVITKIHKVEYFNNRLKFKDENDELITLTWDKLYVYDNYDDMIEQYNKILLININMLEGELNYQLSLKEKYMSKTIANNLKNAIEEMKLNFINTDYIMESITGGF